MGRIMRSRYYKIAEAATVAVSAAAAATFSFQIRELAAAFLVFAVLFGAAGTVLVGLVLMEWAALRGMSKVEGHLARVRVRHSDTSAAIRSTPVRTECGKATPVLRHVTRRADSNLWNMYGH
jgi:hypothetical protein